MNKLLLITIIILLLGCESPDIPDTTPTATPEPTATSTPEPPQPENTMENDIIFSLYDGEKIMYYDGIETQIAYYGKINNAGNKKFSINDILYHFDNLGNPTLTEWLPTTPDAIKAIEIKNKSIVYQDDIWILEDIDPDTALSLGAQYKHYTKIYHNLDVLGLWNLNEWEVKSVINTLSGNIIAIDTLSGYHNLTGNEAIYYAEDSGLMIHTFNSNTKTAYIKTDTGNYQITWSLNFFNSAKWQKANDIWYSHNGYTFDEINGLQENTNILKDWNVYPYPIETIFAEAPVIIPAGVRLENNIEVTYWTECNTGTLYRHVPNVDRIDVITDIYISDGLRTTGIQKASVLKPKIIEDKIYFHEGSNIKEYDFLTGIVNIFSNDMELIVW